MSSNLVVIASIGFQDPTQMRLAPNHPMIQTLPSNRSDQPFGKAILPRRSWCGRLVPDAHGAQSARDNVALALVPIPGQIVRSFIPRKGLRYLTCNPFCRQICCGPAAVGLASNEPATDEGIEQVETDSW